MLLILQIALGLAALYSAGMYGCLTYLHLRYNADVETPTFHLGQCFILATGFLALTLVGN